MFLISILLGRTFCGWLCPAGGLQECCFTAFSKKAQGGKYDFIKYFIWVPWISAIIILTIGVGGFNKINLLYQIDYGISVSNIYGYIIYYFFVGLIVVLALTAGKRAFCHYVCWMAPFMVIGTKLRIMFRLPSLRLRSNGSGCNQCKLCAKNCPNGSIKFAFFR